MRELETDGKTLETQVGDVWTTMALREAKTFSLEFGIDQELKFNHGLQSQIFDLFFAHYYLRKEGGETEYLLNSASMETLRKIPLIKRLPLMLDKIHADREKAAVALLAKAKEKSEEFENRTENAIYEEIADRLDKTTEYVKDIITQNEPGIPAEMILLVGSPNAIQRAANLLSSANAEKKKVDETTFKTKVKTLLESIKKRDFPRTQLAE